PTQCRCASQPHGGRETGFLFHALLGEKQTGKTGGRASVGPQSPSRGLKVRQALNRAQYEKPKQRAAGFSHWTSPNGSPAAATSRATRAARPSHPFSAEES